METVIPGIVMFADPVAAPLVTEAAVTATTKLPAGGLAGAVYLVIPPLGVMAGETEPQSAAGHVTLQLTPIFAESPVTLAVTVVVPGIDVAVPGGTMAAADMAAIVIPGTVTIAPEVVPGLLTALAVMVTAKLPAGGTAGAV